MKCLNEFLVTVYTKMQSLSGMMNLRPKVDFPPSFHLRLHHPALDSLKHTELDAYMGENLQIVGHRPGSSVFAIHRRIPSGPGQKVRKYHRKPGTFLPSSEPLVSQACVSVGRGEAQTTLCKPRRGLTPQTLNPLRVGHV
jgi:hypothetical protein